MGEDISSYQKGIDKILQHQEDFEMLISEYLLSVNSKYNSNMFPTTQIAKVLMGKMKLVKTKFPIIHKIVRIILEEWKNNGWCEYVTTTKSGKNRKNKFIYQFSNENFQFLKAKFISSSINELERAIKESGEEEHLPHNDAMKSREIILEDWLFKIQDIINGINLNIDSREKMDLE